MAKIKIVLSAAAGIIFCAAALYLYVKYSDERGMRHQLGEVLNQTIQDRDQLAGEKASLEKALREKEEKLESLRDVQGIKNSLENSYKLTRELNDKMAQLENERTTLLSANLNISARLENTNRELAKALESVRASRSDSAKADSAQLAELKKRIDGLNQANLLKDSEAQRFQAEVSRLQKLNQDLAAKGEQVEQRLKAFDSENAALKQQLARLSDPAFEKAGGQFALKNLQEQARELQQSLAQRQARIDVLEAQIRSGQGKPESPGVVQLYEKAKDQISELSQLLLRKEGEIEKARKDAFDAKEKLLSLQGQAAKLENELTGLRQSRERVSRLESERLELASRVNELEAAMSKKSELSESLQRNIEYLTQQLAGKEEQVRAVAEKVSKDGSASKEELERQKARLAEINLLYNSLKTQVQQFSEALTLKEAELEQHRQEAGQYREEIASLRQRSSSLEGELSEAKERQKKLLEDLIASVRLNSVLQEKSRGGQPALQAETVSRAEREQQRKADDLRRRIEIMLEPARK